VKGERRGGRMRLPRSERGSGGHGVISSPGKIEGRPADGPALGATGSRFGYWCVPLTGTASVSPKSDTFQNACVAPSKSPGPPPSNVTEVT